MEQVYCVFNREEYPDRCLLGIYTEEVIAEKFALALDGVVEPWPVDAHRPELIMGHRLFQVDFIREEITVQPTTWVGALRQLEQMETIGDRRRVYLFAPSPVRAIEDAQEICNRALRIELPSEQAA